MDMDLENQLRDIKRSRRLLREQVDVLEQRRSAVSVQAQDAEKMMAEAENRAIDGKALIDMGAQLKTAQERSEQIKGEIAGIAAEEKEVNDKLFESRKLEAEAQAIVDEFYNKIGRKAKYSSDEDYKAAVEKEIEELEKFLDFKEKDKKRMKTEAEQLRNEVLTQNEETEIHNVFTVKKKYEEMRKQKMT
ncbi:hypothetical protein QTN25_007884 [Entamoeba marina]